MANSGMWRRVLAGLAVLAGFAMLAPAAGASITPTVTLDQSAGTQAGGTANLGVDIKFAPSSGDSPDDLALSLPPGLLANASIDNGACLASATPIAACQVGTGTVTAVPAGLGTPQVTVNVVFDLVAPPSGSGDLAGLAVIDTSNSTQLGSTAGVAVRSSSDPAGVGLNIGFTDLPKTYTVPLLGNVAISIQEIKSTFANLRYPTTCPSTPAKFTVAANSYSASAVQFTTAPVNVTGCSSLAFSPTFTFSATRDTADSQVQVVTDITQPAGQAPSQSVDLAFPLASIAPNLAVVSAICANPASGTCQSLGSVTATSPLYPAPLTGKAYLTGSITSPALTLVLPPPFSLTLSGAVSLSKNSTTFTGLPDIPLSDLKVSLDGGADGVFTTNCLVPSGTATATLTSQNGDKTATLPDPFTISGCPPPSKSGSGGSGSGGGTGSTDAKPKLSDGSITGLASGKPTVKFKVAAVKGGAKLEVIVVKLPSGLSVAQHRVHGKLTITGVSARGGSIKSVSKKSGRLAITLRKAASSVTVKIGPKALKESSGLRKKAKKHGTMTLGLTISTADALGKVFTNRTTIVL